MSLDNIPYTYPVQVSLFISFKSKLKSIPKLLLMLSNSSYSFKNGNYNFFLVFIAKWVFLFAIYFVAVFPYVCLTKTKVRIFLTSFMHIKHTVPQFWNISAHLHIYNLKNGENITLNKRFTTFRRFLIIGYRENFRKKSE